MAFFQQKEAKSRNSNVEDLSDSESDSSEEAFDFTDINQPPEFWVEEDFPEKPNNKSRGLNRGLQVYADARSTLFKKSPIIEGVEPICCDGFCGIVGLLLVLLIDVAYVAYCSYCNKLATEDDVRLIWLSVLVWLVILVKLARRLVRLGRLKKGYWTVCVPLGPLYHRCVKAIRDVSLAPWGAVWKHVDANEKTIRRRKSWAKKG